MSGTSLDGVDAAWIETDGERVFATGPSLTLPYAAGLRADLRRILDRAPELDEDDPILADAVARLTEVHVQAVLALDRPADIIGFHGQTILHQPQNRRTWQVGDAAMLARLGVRARGTDEDAALAQAAFRAFAEGGERLRWEPFFFDWFCADEERAMASVRGDLYAQPGFAEFRGLLAAFAPKRPERLADPWFARPEPEELLVEEIEVFWSRIADGDDWSVFQAKLESIETARRAWGLTA